MPDVTVDGSVTGDDPTRTLAQLRALVANISDTVLLVDSEGRMSVSTGIKRPLLGYGPSFWQDHTLFDVLHPDDMEQVAHLTEHAARRPEDATPTTVRVRRADDGWAHLEFTAVDRRDDPDVQGFVVTVRDVTERLATEARLAELTASTQAQSDLRVELVGRVSHELRNPVHALQGLVELLVTTELPPTAKELVRAANRQAALLGRIVEDLLEYSRLEVGSPDLDPQPTDLRHLVEDAAELAGDLCRPTVTVRTRVSEDLPANVLVDGARVSQVLTNLATNAAKFTEHGTITIVAARVPDRADTVRLEVVDTGPGIAETEIDRLWRPFEQGTPRTADVHGGAGLGLAITRGLVELLGGTIRVDSAVGAGSRFAVDLEAPATTGEPRRSVLRPNLPPGARVLVVEDNPTNQLLVREQLGRLGVEADVVGTGEEGVAALAPGHPYSLVLMDWQLPGIDGLEATRLVRAQETAGGRTPVLAMTASAMPADAQQCRDAGMDDLLTKPVGLERLAAALQRWSGTPVGDAAGSNGANEVSPVARINSAALDELAEDLGGPGPVRSIVGTYLEELARRRTAVLEAAASLDAETMRSAAHSLKATSVTLGAVAIDALARELESADFPPSAELLARFTATCDATAASMREWLADD